MEVPELATGYRRFADNERKTGVIFLDPNTSYKTHGRRLGVFTSLVVGIVPFLPIVGEYSNQAVDFALHLSISIIIGILEIPFLCTLLQFCQQIQACLAPFEVFMPSDGCCRFVCKVVPSLRSTIGEGFCIGYFAS